MDIFPGISSFSSGARRHAIVIGGSIAGLSVARVLTNHFQHVTVIERDEPPQARLFRKGAPQARHPHVLLKGGELALEQLFRPDIIWRVLAAGLRRRRIAAPTFEAEPQVAAPALKTFTPGIREIRPSRATAEPVYSEQERR